MIFYVAYRDERILFYSVHVQSVKLKYLRKRSIQMFSKQSLHSLERKNL